MPKYRIVKADCERNRNDIISIKERNLGKIDDAYYRWLYRDSPCGPAECWLARDEGTGKFVGSAALFLRNVVVDGNLCSAGIAGDFSVDKLHRTFGPAIMLQKKILSFVKERKDRFIYGVPNDKSKVVMERLGYRSLGKYRRYVKILKCEYKDGEYLVGMPGLRSLCDLVLRYASREAWAKRSGRFTVDIPEEFDSRFDELWNRVVGRYGVIGKRDSKFLAWRYSRSPAREFKIFTLLTGDDLAGYVVYFLKDNMFHIVDLLHTNEDGVLHHLLCEFIRFARSENIGAIDIHYFGSPSFVNTLRRFNFIVHEKATKELYIFMDSEVFPADCVTNVSAWHFLEGDTDRINA